MLYLNNIPIELRKFPNGEIVCNIEDVLDKWMKEVCHVGKFTYYLTFNCYPSDLNDNVSLSDLIMQLLLVVNAIKNHSFYQLNKNICAIDLYIPMLPYSRQDRWMGDGTSVSNKVFIELLNNLKLNNIFTNDIHSDSSRVLFDSGVLCENTQSKCFLDMIDRNNDLFELFDSILFKMFNITNNEQIVFISPDSGAYKKVFDVAQDVSRKYNINVDVVTAQKHRDLKTGQINSTEIELSHIFKDKNVQSKIHFFIIDDLCDGGKTFIELSKAIDANLSNIEANYTKNLFVTHGLFTKGREVVERHFDKVYAYNDLLN